MGEVRWKPDTGQQIRAARRLLDAMDDFEAFADFWGVLSDEVVDRWHEDPLTFLWMAPDAVGRAARRLEFVYHGGHEKTIRRAWARLRREAVVWCRQVEEAAYQPRGQVPA